MRDAEALRQAASRGSPPPTSYDDTSSDQRAA
jgi:hypothetical protein